MDNGVKAASALPNRIIPKPCGTWTLAQLSSTLYRGTFCVEYHLSILRNRS